MNLPDNLKKAFSLKVFLLFFVGVGGLLGWFFFPLFFFLGGKKFQYLNCETKTSVSLPILANFSRFLA